jgi:predicted DNA-binding protein
MLKNITLKLDEQIITRVRHIAVDDNKSVSAWVSELIERTLNDVDEYEQSRRGAIKTLNQGFHLGGQPLGRDEVHDRR